ncbi:hypothetical protein HDU96_003132 [Phlyctochytrium bullatum]|nr:hypothetical protein HDU96_003132 [Phlyctochytrium bullatum]
MVAFVEHQQLTPPSTQTVGPVQELQAANEKMVAAMPGAPTEQMVVPDFYNDADMDLLTFLVAEILERLTAHNDQIPLTASTITRFHSRRPAPISILDYLRRIVRHAHLDRSCLLSLLVYMDRVCTHQKRFTVSSLTVHRFIIAAVTVSSKAHFDLFYSNKVYAEIGGVPLKELNALEMDLVFMMGWELMAGVERMQEYYVNMVRRHPNLVFASA